MISAQTPLAFVARENRRPPGVEPEGALFGIVLYATAAAAAAAGAPNSFRTSAPGLAAENR
jgi:hypothetical protein